MRGPMRAVLLLGLFLGVASLVGCGPTTTGKNYDIRFHVVNEGEGSLDFNPSLEGITSGSSSNEADSAFNLEDLLQLDPQDLVSTLSNLGVDSDVINSVLERINIVSAEKEAVGEGAAPVTTPPSETKDPVTPAGPVKKNTITISTVFKSEMDGRGIWNFAPGFKPPTNFIANAGKCLVNAPIKLGADGRSNPQIGYTGWLFKPTEVSGRGYGVLGKKGECLNLDKVTITYTVK